MAFLCYKQACPVGSWADNKVLKSILSFKMAAKETVGKSKLCIVLPIHYRISQSFFYFINLRGHGFRICKENYQQIGICLIVKKREKKVN